MDSLFAVERILFNLIRDGNKKLPLVIHYSVVTKAE
jgi:hypothetical protein